MKVSDCIKMFVDELFRILSDIDDDVTSIRKDLKDLGNEMKNDFTKIVGPFPAPKMREDSRYGLVSKLDKFQEEFLDIEKHNGIFDSENWIHRPNKKNKLKEEKQLELITENSVDFNNTLCELINLQKEFINTQIKYKAFPK